MVLFRLTASDYTFGIFKLFLLRQISLFSLSIVECQFAGQFCSHLIDKFLIQLYIYFNISVILYINNNFHSMFNTLFS
jgi:hypothetical protein